MSKRLLILFAHPLYEKSRVHKAMVRAVPVNEHITFRDLYEHYPDFNIDIKVEKELLLRHDIIIWQHPFYWYSIPPLLKQWIDLVLEFGWAYGPGGEALTGKYVLNAISAGGREEVYQETGRNRFTVKQFLVPLEQTVRLCHMKFLPPFIIHGTHLLTPEQIKVRADEYGNVLKQLLNWDGNESAFDGFKYMNEILNKNKIIKEQ